MTANDTSSGNFQPDGQPVSSQVLEWAKNNDWYRIETTTNQLRLQLQFGSLIETMARQLEYHNRRKHRRQLFECWDHLLAKCLQVDRVCRAGCRTEDDLAELEFLRSKAVGAAAELAEVIQVIISSRQPENSAQHFENTSQPAATKDEWLTTAQAADILGISRGTVSKWAKKGMLTDNGKTAQQKRFSKVSVLLLKDKRESEDLQKDAADLRRDSVKIR